MSTPRSPIPASPPPPPLMPDSLQRLPAAGRPAQLMILLHGWRARAADMAPLAHKLRTAFAQAVPLAPEGFEAAGFGGRVGRPWFGPDGLNVPDELVTQVNRPARVATALGAVPELAADPPGHQPGNTDHGD